MSRFKLRLYIPNSVSETKKLTIADRFAQVLARLKFEYDLPLEVLAVGEELLHALKARSGTDVERRKTVFVCRYFDRTKNASREGAILQEESKC
jgi:hypothetical protein